MQEERKISRTEQIIQVSIFFSNHLSDLLINIQDTK